MEKDPFLIHYYIQLSNAKLNIPEKSCEKSYEILKLLFVDKINRANLESQCFQGIPEECNGLRSLCWKILLNYLPEFPSKWKATLETAREEYEKYINSYIIPKINADNSSPKKEIKGQVKSSKIEESKGLGPKGFEFDDHPLSTSNNSQWNSFFKDQKLLEDIAKDVKRTRSSTKFFRENTDYPLQKLYAHEISVDKPVENETHLDVLSRILFIYGKLNPNIGYIQGMNEVLAPIYYCFYKDKSSVFIGRIEADVFYCFSNLMKEIQDGFVKKLDNTEGGVQTRVKVLNEYLKKSDKQLWTHLDKYKVDPQFYSLKWLMLLLAQEFSINNLLKVWDRLFAHPKKLDYVYFLSLALIQGVREDLIQGDEFPVIMEVLQKKIGEDLDKIFSTALILYKQFAKPEDLVQHL